MESIERFPAPRVVFHYKGKNIAARHNGPVPRVDELVNIPTSSMRHEPDDDIERFRVKQVTYLIDDGPEPENIGMLARVTLGEAEQRHWYTDD